MSLRKRVNLKLFFTISLPTHGAILFFAERPIEIWALIGVYLATLLNFWMLVNIVEYLALSVRAKKGEPVNKWKVAGFFTGKLLALLIALTLSVQIMGDRLLIPVLSYVIQIFVLGVTLRRT